MHCILPLATSNAFLEPTPRIGAGMAAHVKAFERSKLLKGEIIIASFEAMSDAPYKDQIGRLWTVILTDRRLCFIEKRLFFETLNQVEILGDALRYVPKKDESCIAARFETNSAYLAFKVVGLENEKALGKMLRKLSNLRDALVMLKGFPDRNNALPIAGVSIPFRLMRLNELLDEGIINQFEYLSQREKIIDEIVPALTPCEK